MKTSSTLILCFFIALFSSCNKDLGNYDYIEADSLLVTNLKDTIAIKLGENLKFAPNLASKTNQINQENLSFEWVAYDKSQVEANKRRKILSTKKDIDVLPVLTIGTYPVYLSITDNETGSIWTYPFTLNIKGAYQKYGWFVLSDIADKGHLSFIEDNPEKWNSYPKTYHDFQNVLFSELDGSPLAINGKPKSLVNHTNMNAVIRAAKNYLYINTSEGTTLINVSDGMLYNPTQYAFINETASGNPTSADREFVFTAGSAMAMKNGDLYSMHYVMQTYYNVPVNNEASGKTYKLSPFVALPMGNAGGNILLFDIEAKRFMTYKHGSARAAALSSEGQAIDVTNTQMDLVWMGHTLAFDGQAIAVMKDKAGKLFLLRMTYTANAVFRVESLTELDATFTDINQAKHFAVDNLYGYFFYATDNKLYQYDLDAKVLKLAKDYAGRKITLLKAPHQAALKPGTPNFTKYQERLEPILFSIIVGSNTESAPTNSGKLEVLRVSPLMGPLKESFKPFEGMGKIVDAVYIDNA